MPKPPKQLTLFKRGRGPSRGRIIVTGEPLPLERFDANKLLSALIAGAEAKRDGFVRRDH